MFIDARRVTAGTTIDAGVCVVGSGPVGLSLARALGDSRIDVCLLESGGFRVEPETQSLAEGTSVGVPFLAPEIARVRAFGGTSRRWGGICRPLDADDFEARPWIEHSGWPIAKAALAPFYDRALRSLGIETRDWLPQRWDHGLAPLMGTPAQSRLQPANLAVAPRPRVARNWRSALARNAAVKVYLHANACEIETDATASRVEGIRVVCLDGNSFRVTARIFVLATGGIENARLLLLANKVQPAGLGNGHDLVGRFLMNHPQLAAAWIVPPAGSPALRTAWPRLVSSLQRATLAPATMAAERIAKFSAFLVPVDSPGKHPLHSSEGFRSLSALLGVNPRAAYARDLPALLAAVAGDIGGLAGDLRRKLSALVRGARVVCVLAENEQVPDPESRVTLSASRDRLGLNQVEVRWRLGAQDRRTMCRGIAIVGEELRRSGGGCLLLDEWVEEGCTGPFPGEDWAHHAGTTRMSADPRTGVVDPDCRVHSVENLYVAGASVFPTEGMSPPTLTAMAVAFRLARHIESVLPQARRGTPAAMHPRQAEPPGEPVPPVDQAAFSIAPTP